MSGEPGMVDDLPQTENACNEEEPVFRLNSVEEFREYVKFVTSPEWLDGRQKTFEHDEHTANEVGKFDPNLAALIRRNIQNAREFYEYLKIKAEK